MITYLTVIDHHNHEALVALAPGPGKIIVGVARFIRDPAQPDTAEVAVTVADSWQRRGLATLLLHQLAGRAREEGITNLTAYILTENYPTIALLRRYGPPKMDYDGPTVTAQMDLPVWAIGDTARVAYRPALAAAEVVLARLASLLPLVVHALSAAFAEVVTMFWATTQFVNRVARRLRSKIQRKLPGCRLSDLE